MSYMKPRAVLRGGVALVGSEAPPAEGFCVVLSNTPAVVVHEAEVELRGGVALVGSETIPAEGFSVVPRDALGRCRT